MRWWLHCGYSERLASYSVGSRRAIQPRTTAERVRERVYTPPTRLPHQCAARNALSSYGRKYRWNIQAPAGTPHVLRRKETNDLGSRWIQTRPRPEYPGG